ncbi:DUF3558 domain-containing protein, partial [Streptomyces hygroscopicus]|uniref:DUF3558 domain-containing protein n=2 Tax=Streptomyces hygroscopicus TaxID=1912 RepID=UPI0036BAE6D9
RRDGCRWKLETASGTRYLTIDFQRVVSYDPSVSDDDRAQAAYEKKATAAHIPAATGSPSASSSTRTEGGASSGSGSSSPSGSGSAAAGETGKGDKGSKDSKDNKSGKNDTGGKGDKKPGTPSTDAGASGGSDQTDTAPQDTAPRRLDDLGDDAFLDDQLITKDSGIHRDITLVFRSSNVIATIEYDQWTTDTKRIPSSQELQENAQDLADELTGRLNE